MLAAILTCGLVMTSCLDEQLDNPSTTEPEQTSAKDPGKWWIEVQQVWHHHRPRHLGQPRRRG